MIEFKLPSLGADMDEGKLLEWRIEPGDHVKAGQVVAVVDTAKAAVDVESWDEGTVHELLVQPGETVPVGTVLAIFLAEGESPETSAAPARAAGRPGAQPRAAVGARPSEPLVPAPAEERRRVSPAARRRAEELRVPLDAVSGTGPGGAVTLEDVERAAGAGAAADRSAAMRQAIAAAMSRSKREIPHYYLSETIPLGRATAWLARRNAERPVIDRVLMGAVLLKAVAVTLGRFPELNGHHVDGAFRPSAAVHLGVAISLRQGGLIAPAIHDAAGKALDHLMAELTDLVKRARAGSLRSSELSDPTITVTNLGDQGAESVFGVIYPPQVALVGFGRVTERPWVEEGRLLVVPAVTASLAADHRVSDGHRGALFLGTLRDLLQAPEDFLEAK